MTTETAAEIGRKRLVDSSELKKKYIYTYIKNTSAPSPHEWVQAALASSGQGRGLWGQHPLLTGTCLPLRVPRLQFQSRDPGVSPSGKGEGVWRTTLPSAPPSLGLAAGVKGLAKLFGDPTPPPDSQVHCPCRSRKCRGGVGRAGTVVAQSGGCAPGREPQA